MGTWLPAALPAAVALALLLGPGWVLARLAGVRGLVAAGAAAGLSIGVLGVSAVVAGAAGVRWSPLVVVAGTAVSAAGAFALGRWVRGEAAADARRRAALAAAALVGPRHRAGAHAARAAARPAGHPAGRPVGERGGTATAPLSAPRAGGATSLALLERPVAAVTAPPHTGTGTRGSGGTGGSRRSWPGPPPAPPGAHAVPTRRELREAARRADRPRGATAAGVDVAERPWVVAAAAAAGLLTALALTLPRTLEAIGTPRAVSQSFDAVFHLNAVRHVLVTGDASSLTLGTLTAPERTTAFYPAAWHGLVALVAQASGAGVDVATNATAVVVAAVLCPLATAAMVRALAGPRPVAVALGAALPAAVVAAPQVQLEWGVLYPLVLSSLALPAGLALLVTAVRRGGAGGLRGPVVRPGVGAVRLGAAAPRRRFAHLGVAAALVPGMALAQTSTVFALMVLTLPLGVAALAGWAARRSGTGRTGWLVAVAGVLATVGVVAAGWAWVDASATIASLRTTDWVAKSSWQQAVRHAAVMGYLGRPAALLPAALAAAGLVLALFHRGWRWLAAAHLLGSALYVFARGVDSDLSQVLTGFWYNDAYRMPVLPAVTGIALAALAGGQLLALAARALPGARGRAPAVQLAGCALALAAVVLGAGGPSVQRGYAELAANHAVTDDVALADMLSRSERRLLERLPEHVPEGVAVAGNPWNASALVYGLTGRPTPFPHLQHAFDPPRRVVAERLRDAATDPAVCPAVRELGVGYVLDFGPARLWGGDDPEAGRDRRYPGLEGLDDPAVADGFELVDREGGARLYRVAACG